MSEKYFFTLKGEELVEKLFEKIESFQDYVVNNGLAHQWAKNKDFYENKFYSVIGDDYPMDILDAGEQGELLATAFNYFRSTVRHMLNPALASIPKFTVGAINSGTKARRATEIGKGIIQYYEKTKRYNKFSNQTLEYAIVYGVGYQIEEFNQGIGKEFTKRTENPDGSVDITTKKEGDFDVSPLSVWDMFFDYTRKFKHDWRIFRRKVNKYELAASVGGKLKERIEKLEPFYRTDKYFNQLKFQNDVGLETDDIFLYSAYHVSVDGLLDGGKYVLFCGGYNCDKIVIAESDNPYGDEIPVFEIKPAEYLENSFGFSECNILRAPQEWYNDLLSKAASNAQSGINDVWVGAELDSGNYERMESGRVVWKTKMKPEVINLYNGDNGLLQLMAICTDAMQILSAQNSVVMGDIKSAPNLKSGIAIQTVATMAQQYMSGFYSSRDTFFEDIWSFRLKTLKKVADEKRLIEIIGKNKATMVKEFSKEDLDGITRAIVFPTNPILNTPAGNIEIAQQYMHLSGGKFSFNDFLEVVHTGNLESTLDDFTAMLDYAEQVKEALLDGKPVQAVMGVDHRYLIKEVQSLLCNIPFVADPANQQVVMNISKFLSEEMNLLRMGDEISNLIYAGVPPTPIANPNAMPMPQANQGSPQPVTKGEK